MGKEQIRTVATALLNKAEMANEDAKRAKGALDALKNGGNVGITIHGATANDKKNCLLSEKSTAGILAILADEVKDALTNVDFYTEKAGEVLALADDSEFDAKAWEL